MNKTHNHSFHKYERNNKNKKNINNILNEIKKYEINNYIFNKYDEIKELGVVISNNIKKHNNINKLLKNKNKKVVGENNQSSNNVKDIYYNECVETVRTFITNFDIVKYFLIKNNNVKDKKDFSGILESFNNDFNMKPTKTTNKELDFQQYKIKICELLQKNTSIIKSVKLNPGKLYERVVDKNYKSKHTNDYEYEFDIFMALLCVLNIKFTYVSDKCAYIANNDFSNENYLIIKNTHTTLSKNKFIKQTLYSEEGNGKGNDDEKINGSETYTLIQLKNEDYNILNNKLLESNYILSDLKKPLKSPSVYKVKELQTIAQRLTIIINKSNGKPKTKQELYDEVSNKIINSL